jgi:pilus assembly protein FimV
VGKSVIKISVVALAFLLLPSLAVAAGLGKLTVFSGLGQRLNAEIELVFVQKGEADTLSVRLPPAEAFRQASIEYGEALLSLKFSIAQRGEGRHVIVISSTQPMNEPFVDLLVELAWSTGRLVREYTFLLDPPEYKGPQPAAEVTAPAVTSAPVTEPVQTPSQPETRTGAPLAEKPLAPAAPAAVREAKAAYQVKRGDTLSKIANANKSDGISLQQMLIALYRSNTDAFDGNNINRLRAGKILNIPDQHAAASVDQADATRLVIAQAADFNEYRRKLGAAVAAAPEPAESRRQRASGKITAQIEDKPAAAKAAKDQLKLSKAEEPAKPGKPGAKRSPEGLQEDMVAKEKALKEANERVAMLEKNVQDMQKLLELKSQSGAQLQQQAAKTGAAKVAEPAKAPEPAKAADIGKTGEPAKAAEPAKAGEPAKVADVAKAAPKAAPKALKPPPPPPPEPSLIDEILDNPLALYGGGGSLLLLFAGYGYYAWRRKKSLQKIDSSAIGGPGFAVDSVFGAAGAVGAVGGVKVDTAPSETESSFSQGGAAAASDTAEVDPIAEADVYMAYGRNAQAEEILKEALVKEPSRQAIRGKLLEIYAGRNDAKAFESVATELHAATGGVGAEWEAAVTLGLQLDPENPLYGGVAAAVKTRDPTGTQVLYGAGVAAVAGAAPEIAPDTGVEGAAPTGLDFDFDLGAEEKKPADAVGGTTILDITAPGAPDAGAPIDFDFELPASGDAAQSAQPQATGQAPTATVETPAAGDSGGIDFDFNLDVPAQEENAPAAPLDLSSISLDLGVPGGAAAPTDAHWQEVATKLDLAKAYQEMGDKDGARELLNEVLKEGDAAQQQQAQTMLSVLG